MKSYTAQIIYRIFCEGLATEQYEEQWIILFAEDETQALSEAVQLGRQEECQFQDRHGRTVSWELAAVKEIREVPMRHGTLIFSTLKEAEPIAAPVWSVDRTQKH